MDLNTLTAISPIDGRYRDKVAELDEYFSEFALIRYRVKVEIEYFIALKKIRLKPLRNVDLETVSRLRNIFHQFDLNDAKRIKEIEKTTNHDVKAVEYFLKEKFDHYGLQAVKEFIHFGLTSQDINNTAIPLSIKDFLRSVYYPLVNSLLRKIKELARSWNKIPMLARTHGQPASPTRLGKEFLVFAERLQTQFYTVSEVPLSAKFGGATGNFNAHVAAFPVIDWSGFADEFVEKTLGLKRSKITTQVEHYDNLAALFDNMKRVNTILIDMNRDIWHYISIEYFKQKINENEVGSSAMPHKVNPIDFENSEGNLGYANAIFEHLSAKLPVSRLQRDLTDSTVLRNIGVPLAHTLIAFKSLLKGLDKLVVNEDAINDDLKKNWNVVAEAIQTILRREGYPNPYEVLKKLTRSQKPVNKESMEAFIDSLEISKKVKLELKRITPMNYTGIY